MFNADKMVKDLTEYINKNGLDSDCDTPDYIIAEYLVSAYQSLRVILQSRDTWYNFKPWSKPLTIELDRSVFNISKEDNTNE